MESLPDCRRLGGRRKAVRELGEYPALIDDELLLSGVGHLKVAP